MHVVIDGVGNARGGGWSVLVRTTRELAQDARIERITVFCSPLDLADYDAPNVRGVAWLPRADEHHSRRRRMRWYAEELNATARGVGGDVLLAMNGMGHTQLPSVSVVQQAFVASGSVRTVRPRALAAKLAVVRRLTQRAVREATAVVTQSTWMRQALWATTGVNSAVIPLGLPREPAVRNDARDESVAWIGSTLGYKRRDVADDAVARAGLSLRTAERGPMHGVWNALQHAQALLVTSEIESLGLPILEAFAIGCPVVAPDLGWARSVADNAAAYFPAANRRSAARRLTEITDDRTLAQDLSSRGRNRFAAMWDEQPYRVLGDLLCEAAA